MREIEIGIPYEIKPEWVNWNDPSGHEAGVFYSCACGTCAAIANRDNRWDVTVAVPHRKFLKMILLKYRSTIQREWRITCK